MEFGSVATVEGYFTADDETQVRILAGRQRGRWCSGSTRKFPPRLFPGHMNHLGGEVTRYFI